MLYMDFQWTLKAVSWYKKSPQRGYFSGVGRF
nr:MAG TPA: hypothetical protein [Caudoviricetes sp.]DAS94527.1 MAG TPA: hypothetical protein [Caudoviricetes sp.]